jgi:hypothetical protein
MLGSLLVRSVPESNSNYILFPLLFKLFLDLVTASSLTSDLPERGSAIVLVRLLQRYGSFGKEKRTRQWIIVKASLISAARTSVFRISTREGWQESRSC